MKKVLYILLLVLELAAGFILLTLVTSVAGWIYFGIVTAVWALLMVWLLIKLKRSARERSKHKIKVAIALVMLLPAIGAFAGIGWFVWSMASAGLI